MIPFLDLKAPHVELRAEIDAAIARVVDSGWYVLGPEVEAFAEYAAWRCAMRSAWRTNRCAAPRAACAMGPGDVIVPSNTYIATWLAVSQCGARPVSVDPWTPRTTSIRAYRGGADGADQGDFAGSSYGSPPTSTHPAACAPVGLRVLKMAPRPGARCWAAPGSHGDGGVESSGQNPRWRWQGREHQRR